MSDREQVYARRIRAALAELETPTDGATRATHLAKCYLQGLYDTDLANKACDCLRDGHGRQWDCSAAGGSPPGFRCICECHEDP